MMKQLRNLALIASLAILPACKSDLSERVFIPVESPRQEYRWEVPRTIALSKDARASRNYIASVQEQVKDRYFFEKEMDLNKDERITLSEQEKYLEKYSK
jgi:hypothetical protein